MLGEFPSNLVSDMLCRIAHSVHSLNRLASDVVAEAAFLSEEVFLSGAGETDRHSSSTVRGASAPGNPGIDGAQHLTTRDTSRRRGCTTRIGVLEPAPITAPLLARTAGSDEVSNVLRPALRGLSEHVLSGPVHVRDLTPEPLRDVRRRH